MRRRPFPRRAASRASAALALLFLSLWLLSGWRLLTWRCGLGDHRFEFTAAMGLLSFQHWRTSDRVPGESLIPGAFSATPYIEEGPAPSWYWWTSRIFQRSAGTVAISIPLWLPFLASAALAGALARRRRPPGACPRCGYDLTGNTTSICPECGFATP